MTTAHEPPRSATDDGTPAVPEPVRVVVVDDQELVRSGLQMVLGAHPDVDVIGEAADGQGALDVVDKLRPDVVLMDVRMPVMDGIEATRRLRERHGSRPDGGPGVLILTTFALDEYAFDALLAGAGGFLAKDAPVEGLVAAIRDVHRGDAVVSPHLTRALVEHFVTARQNGAPKTTAEVSEAAGVSDALTPRENDVLVHIAAGLSNAEIAAELVVSEVTVKTHVGRILTKLDLRDRTQAVIYAYEHGIVQVRGDSHT